MADSELPPLDLVKELSPKQREIIKLARAKTGAKKIIGLFGTRKSGKSIGMLHAVVDHMWRTRDATVLLLVRAQGDGSSGGMWTQIIKDILPLWMTHSIGGEEMAFPEGGEPRATISKKLTFKVTNIHGGVSTLMMDSLDNENEVEKYKARSYTCVAWAECGEFVEDMSFTTLFMALRGIGYEQDEFLFLLDANPPKDGEEHWLYKRFYEDRVKEDQAPQELALTKCLYVTEWSFADNPYITQQEIDETRALYMSDPELYDRFCLAMWKRATRDLLFGDLFQRANHTYGSSKDGMLLLPSEDCRELITSTDPGGMNPVTYIFEQITESVAYTTREGKEAFKDQKTFQYLDEIATIGKETKVSEHTDRVCERMDFWEHESGWQEDHLVLRTRWKHFADRSALDFKESITMRSVADEVFAHTEGRIKFIGVEKGRGSVEHRVRLLRKLLMDKRILIGGLRCPGAIAMFEKIKKAKEGEIKKGDPLKHFTDALSYGLVNLLWDELQIMTRRVRIQARNEIKGSSLVTVNL